MLLVQLIHIGSSARRLILPAMLTLCGILSTASYLRAQDAKQTRSDESWTATRDLNTANTNPSRTTESHSKSGNRTIDTQKLEVLGPDGRYVPSTETEAETIQVDANTTRTVVRTYTWDGNGRRQLSRVTEEESQATPNGNAHIVRKTSAADANGSLQLIQREVQDTTKMGANTEETKRIVSRPDSYGGFSQAEQTVEVNTRNADNSLHAKKTRQMPDGNGGWRVLDVTEKTVHDDGKNRTTDERLLQPDVDGKLTEASRTVSQEAETPTGEKKKTVETYSNFIPGYSDSSMHLNQRVTTIQKKDSGGEVIEEQVEQRSGANASDAPKVTEKTKYVVKYGYSGTQQTKTVEARDGGGNFYVMSVENKKAEGTAPAPNPPATPEKPY